jgi:hypothetical protein
MPIRIEMRDGIFSFYIRSDETAIRAIAIVENDSIRDLIAATSISSNAWSLSTGCKKRIVIPIGVIRHWNTLTPKAAPCVVYQRDSKVKRGEEQFWFEGGSDADKRIRVEIQGAWLQNLPWHRAAHRQK